MKGPLFALDWQKCDNNDGHTAFLKQFWHQTYSACFNHKDNDDDIVDDNDRDHDDDNESSIKLFLLSI